MTANYYKYSATMGDRTYFTSVIHHDHLGERRYFSNIESEIYFGDQEMTDLYQFEFGIDEKVLPVYGYNCYYASELVSGQRIVQGQFVVNYTDVKLIQSTLSNIEDSIYKEITAPDYLPGGDLHHAIYDKQFDIMIGYGYYNHDKRYEKDGYPQTYRATCQTIIGAKISGMHKVMDTTGQPILEVFTFVAKDFVEENIAPVTPGGSTPSQGEKPKEESITKPTFKCSDVNNKQELATHDEEAKKSGCPHFIHSLKYANGRLSLHVRESSGKSITLKKGSFEIYRCDNIPLLEAEANSKNSIDKKLPEKYAIELNKLIKGGSKKFMCSIYYEVAVGDQVYNVEHSETIMLAE